MRAHRLATPSTTTTTLRSAPLRPPTGRPVGAALLQPAEPASAPRRAASSTIPAAAAPGQAAMAPSAVTGVKDKQPFIIVGGGRVGGALAAMGEADVIIRRGEPFPDPAPAGPIIVATRNDALAAVVASTPPARRGDLVFIQNGHLQPWLDGVGLGDATQVLVYFAVAAAGDAPTDGVTDANPEGLTAATGRWAHAVAARLGGAGLACKVLPKAAFDVAMLEKLVWISAFMLVGANHGGITVGEVESKHGPEVSALIAELAAAGADDMGLKMEDGATVITRLMAYARAVTHFPTAVKEFEWRNGYFWGLSQGAAKSGKADPCPRHSALLKKVGAV